MISKKLNSKVSFFLLLIMISACAKSVINHNSVGESSTYIEALKTWKSNRIATLKKPTGYLSMIGLYWLKEGTQNFGSGGENDIIFPKKFPEKLGSISLHGDSIYVNVLNPLDFSIDSENVPSARLKSDADGNMTMMNSKSYFWYIIKRGKQYGIRLKDTLAESRLSLTSIPSYEVSEDWVINGTYTPVKQDSSITITNKVGITYQSKFMGSLSFIHNGIKHQLLATDGGEGKLFIVFADQTTGLGTYGGGRFLYVDIPNSNQSAILDFNKAENPICAFSDYATCPLPPKENYLPFTVSAGEKRVR